MANFDPHDPEESHTSSKDPQQGGKTPLSQPHLESPRSAARATKFVPSSAATRLKPAMP